MRDLLSKILIQIFHKNLLSTNTPGHLISFEVNSYALSLQLIDNLIPNSKLTGLKREFLVKLFEIEKESFSLIKE